MRFCSGKSSCGEIDVFFLLKCRNVGLPVNIFAVTNLQFYLIIDSITDKLTHLNGENQVLLVEMVKMI